MCGTMAQEETVVASRRTPSAVWDPQALLVLQATAFPWEEVRSVRNILLLENKAIHVTWKLDTKIPGRSDDIAAALLSAYASPVSRT
jgi:hypothetical protein